MKNLTTLKDTHSVRILSSKQMLNVKGGTNPPPSNLNPVMELTADEKRRQRPGGGVSTQ